MGLALSIIIVNWNVRNFLKECLKSIYLNISKLAFEIIVVDNASSDGSIRMLENNFPMVRIIKNKINEGFAKANNQAMKESRGRYILLLNPDTLIIDNSLFKMVDFMDSNPKVGAVGSRLMLPNGLLEAGAAGYKPSLVTAFNYYFFLSKLFPSIFRGLYLDQNSYRKKAIAVEWVSGACMMLRRELLNRNILFNEEFFMYAEDIELCDRIRKNGWEIYYTPQAKIIHFRGGSVKKRSADPSTIQLRGLEQYFKRNHGVLSIKILYFFGICGFFLRAILYKMLFYIRKDEYHQKKATELKKCWLNSVRLLFSLKD